MEYLEQVIRKDLAEEATLNPRQERWVASGCVQNSCGMCVYVCIERVSKSQIKSHSKVADGFELGRTLVNLLQYIRQN